MALVSDEPWVEMGLTSREWANLHRGDLNNGHCTNHLETCMIPGCDHTRTPQREYDIARAHGFIWKMVRL